MILSSKFRGFTLLEILLVVLIVSIMTAVGANIINSQSIDRVIMNQAQRFSDDLTYVCEKSVLENQAYGIEFFAHTYQVVRYQQGDWLMAEQQTPVHKDADIEINLLLAGISQKLTMESATKDALLPHIICQTDGSFNEFELRFSAVDELSQGEAIKPNYYSLVSQTPWQLSGGWHQP